MPIIDGTAYVFQPALPMRGVTMFTSERVMLSCVFQPALPMRGVTDRVERDILVMQISTRTPHAGSDDAGQYQRLLSFDFNPHSPCGE